MSLVCAACVLPVGAVNRDGFCARCASTTLLLCRACNAWRPELKRDGSCDWCGFVPPNPRDAGPLDIESQLRTAAELVGDLNGLTSEAERLLGKWLPGKKRKR